MKNRFLKTMLLCTVGYSLVGLLSENITQVLAGIVIVGLLQVLGLTFYVIDKVNNQTESST
jgi:hypothetical protein